MQTDLQAVRQAAEEIIEDHGCRAITPWKTVRLAADYILATIPADGHLTITPEWLRQEWGFEYAKSSGLHLRMEAELLNGMRLEMHTTDMIVCFGGWPLTTKLSTRHEAGAIFTSLGIQRKRKDGA